MGSVAGNIEDIKHLFDRISDYNAEWVLADAAAETCKNTTNWILPYVERLLAGSEDSSLWLHGIGMGRRRAMTEFLVLTQFVVGSGKTTMAYVSLGLINRSILTIFRSTVIKSYGGKVQPHVPVIHFFFDARQRWANGALFVLESLAKQLLSLLHYSNKIPPEVEEAVRWVYYTQNDSLKAAERAVTPMRWNVGSRHGELIALNELTERIILPSIAAIPGLLVVIDGIDECRATRHERYALLEILSKCTNKGAKVFVSGRKEAAITVLSTTPIEVEISKAREEVRNDMSTFIQSEFTRRMKHQKISNQENTWKSIQDTLLDMSDAM